MISQECLDLCWFDHQRKEPKFLNAFDCSTKGFGMVAIETKQFQEPQSVNQAMADPRCLDAMKLEYNALQQNAWHLETYSISPYDECGWV